MPERLIPAGGPSAGAESIRAKVVRMGILSSIEHLDPRDAVDDISGLVLGQVFEAPYVIMAGETRVTPLLFAETLRHEGGLTYSAAVRENVFFSDGTPLTAEIAAQSLRRAKILSNRAEIEAKGDRVYFTLMTPNPRFELTLTQGNSAIVFEKEDQLLGTGPFVFDQRPLLHVLRGSTTLRLLRNPYFSGSTSVEEVQFIVCPADEDGTPRALVEAFRGDDVDLTTALTMTDLTIYGLTSLHPSMQPGNSTGVLFFHTERKVFASAAVRRGIAMCIDPHEIAERSYDTNPAAFVATSLLPPMMRRTEALAMTNREKGLWVLEHSRAKPQRLSLLVPWAPRPYLPKPMRAAEAIRNQLSQAGIVVELIETKSGEEFFDDLEAGRYDMALAGWIADTPDPADFFEALLWSKMTEGQIHSNHSRWHDGPTDAALAAFRAQPSEENRKAIENLIANEAPLLPLIYGQAVVVHSRRLQNVRCTATGVVTLAGVAIAQ